MRILLSVMLLLALVVSGCSWMKGSKKPAKEQPRTTTQETQPAEPGNAAAGKVALVNGAGRFVVLNFPLGKMAAVDQHLFVYHRSSKVGEVKITGPQHGENIVADLVSGKAEVGDEVRTQ